MDSTETLLRILFSGNEYNGKYLYSSIQYVLSLVKKYIFLPSQSFQNDLANSILQPTMPANIYSN